MPYGLKNFVFIAKQNREMNLIAWRYKAVIGERIFHLLYTLHKTQ